MTVKLASYNKINADGIISSNELITNNEGYSALLSVLQVYLESTESNDLTDILSGGEYWPVPNRPADSAFWEYWLEALEEIRKGSSEVADDCNKLITEKEGYEAMLYMLEAYWRGTGSTYLTDILSGGKCWLEKVRPVDNPFWEYWLEAIERVRSEGSPPVKKLLQP